MAVDNRRDTWGSQHAPTKEAYAAEAPLRAQQKAAADKQQQQRQARLAKNLDRAFIGIEQPVPSNKSSTNLSTTVRSPQQAAPDSAKEASTYATMTRRNVSRRAQKSTQLTRAPTERQVNWAQRLLQPGPDKTGYTIV